MKDFFGGFLRLIDPALNSEARAHMSYQSSHPSYSNSDFLSHFLESLTERKASQRTIQAYSHDIKKFIESCGQDVAALQPPEIERYIERLAQSGAKFSTVKRTLSAVREFFYFLVDQSEIEQNPAERVKITPVPRNVLPPEDVVSLFHYVAQQQRSNSSQVSLRYRRDELILLLMIFYGVRQYQIPLLKLSAIERNEELFTLRVNEMLVNQLPPMLETWRVDVVEGGH